MLQDKIIKTLHNHFQAHVDKHVLNIQIMLDNPQSIPEHTDFLESIEKELDAIAEYLDKIEALAEVELSMAVRV